MGKKLRATPTAIGREWSWSTKPNGTRYDMMPIAQLLCLDLMEEEEGAGEEGRTTISLKMRFLLPPSSHFKSVCPAFFTTWSTHSTPAPLFFADFIIELWAAAVRTWSRLRLTHSALSPGNSPIGKVNFLNDNSEYFFNWQSFWKALHFTISCPGPANGDNIANGKKFFTSKLFSLERKFEMTKK